MPIEWVKEKRGSREGPIHESDGSVVYRRHYLAKSLFNRESGVVVVSAVGIPYGALLREDLRCSVRRINPVQNNINPRIWDVEVEWSSASNNENQGQDPPDWKPKIRCRFVSMPKVRMGDLDGKAFVDAAGTPFDPTPEVPMYCDEITIERYETLMNRPMDRRYMGAVNSDSWFGADRYTCLMADINKERVVIENRYYWHCVYTILIHPYAIHPHKILNRGPLFLDANGKKKCAVDELGVTHNGLVMLDKTGKLLERGKEPYWLYFRLNNLMMFNPLMLI